jgi:type II secretory pathway component HofQ
MKRPEDTCRRPSRLAAAWLCAAALAGAAAATAADGRPEPATVSVDLVRADLIDVLRYLCDRAGDDLVVAEGVRGEVTMRLIDVPVDQALAVVLKAQGLAAEREAGVVYVATAADLSRRLADEAMLAEARDRVRPLVTVIIALGHASAAEVAAVVEATALSERGSVAVDAQRNRLIVTDLAERLPVARATAERLDR